MEERVLLIMDLNELKKLIDERIAAGISHEKENARQEKLLNRREVADLLRVSLVTLNNWMKQGQIIYYKVNSRIFFKYSDVMAALKTSPIRRKK